MSLSSRVLALAQAIAADIKALATGKVDTSTLSSYRTVLNASFDMTSTRTAYEPSLAALTYAARFNYTIKPVGDSQAIHPSIISNFVVDTSQGNLVGNAHGIGHFDIFTIKGGGTCNLLFGKETRIALENNSTLTEFLLHKWVFEPNATNSGTIGTVTLDGLDDQSASAPYIGMFRRLYADPRMVDYYNGGIIQPPAIVDASRTFSDRDSGKIFYLNSGANATFTFPSTLSDGFRVKIIQGTLGGKITMVSGGRTILANTARVQTQFSFDTVEILAAGGAFLLLDWKDPLPTYTLPTTSATTRAVTTNASVPELVVTLEPNSIYDIDCEMTYTTTAAAQSLKLGFASTLTGAVFTLNGAVQITNVPGTAVAVSGPLNSTSATVAGTASVASVDQNASIKGKIKTGSAGGTFTIQVGAISTASTLTIAAGKAVLSAKKIQ